MRYLSTCFLVVVFFAGDAGMSQSAVIVLDGSFYVIPISTQESCNSNHLDLCTTSGDCEKAGGYWYDDTCNSSPPPTITGLWSGIAQNQMGCRWSLTTTLQNYGSDVLGNWLAQPITSWIEGCDATYSGYLDGTVDFHTMKINFGVSYNDNYGGGYLLFDGTVSASLQYMSGTWEGVPPLTGTWYLSK